MNRDESLRRAVATLPCARCGVEGYTQVAHSNLSEHGKGRGLKAGDWYVMPLCCTRVGVPGCHVELDQLIGMTAEEAEELTKKWIINTYVELWLRGLINVDIRKIPKP